MPLNIFNCRAVINDRKIIIAKTEKSRKNIDNINQLRFLMSCEQLGRLCVFDIPTVSQISKETTQNLRVQLGDRND